MSAKETNCDASGDEIAIQVDCFMVTPGEEAKPTTMSIFYQKNGRFPPSVMLEAGRRIDLGGGEADVAHAPSSEMGRPPHTPQRTPVRGNGGQSQEGTVAMTLKKREARLRRSFTRLDLSLKKTPARKGSRELYGAGYMVTNPYNNTVVLGALHREFDATIEDLEEYLASASAA